ncbi:hypothetical protein K432DRAFT_440587 [Lepidopterella palustris CBS 459.81]|uniref:Phosphatidate phosphatase APP1 catalytic domain-containing protein n=1 Tax=Lepidopterella palustris CBS 459.81 TaxID=1314670 RepID=A0A8E2EH59_9PEZI|nr:hypothetical protein K432DRAFT_440587 [Lepidopterella palustris CBS 459.81]
MPHKQAQQWLLLAAWSGIASAVAIPSPTVLPGQVVVPAPIITPAAIQFDATRSYQRRNLISKIESDVGSVLTALGSDIPSYVISGVPNYFQNFPTGSQVQSSLGLSDSDLAAIPTQVLNIPPYGNWTDQGWQIRFHGNVYKMPNLTTSKLNDLANIFLIGTDITSLPDSQQDQARNLTAEIFVVQQSNQNVSFFLEPAPSAGASGQPGGGGGVTPAGGSQNVTFPYETTLEGDFDAFVPILNVTGGGLMAGNETDQIQRLNVYTNGSIMGNATAYLVPPTGLTFISDIDDILRITKIYEPKEGLLNSFARPFVPWMNMPDIYANWSRSLPNGTHFHYLTTTPEQVTRNYMDFIYKTYPGGSFDTRPLNFSDVNATLSIRMFLLQKIFQTYPQRKFVLVADTSNSDVMRDYPTLAHDYPSQVQCIFLRNTSATDSGDKFPYDTSKFQGLNNRSYMFFLEPNDLMNLDIEGGNCLNTSIMQNLTFGIQDEALGFHGSSGGRLQGKATISFVVAVVAAMVLLL